MSSSHVCVKQEIIYWMPEFLLLHLICFHSLLSPKAVVWESIPECICILGHNWKQNNVFCVFLSHLILGILSVTSLWRCLFSIYYKEVIISALFKRSLLDLLLFRYYQFFLLYSAEVISLLHNNCSYCRYLLYLSHLFFYSFHYFPTHYFFYLIFQISKLPMCLQDQVFSHQGFSLIQRGKYSNFQIVPLIYITGYHIGLIYYIYVIYIQL